MSHAEAQRRRGLREIRKLRIAIMLFHFFKEKQEGRI
jgi:hypothetical protein